MPTHRMPHAVLLACAAAAAVSVLIPLTTPSAHAGSSRVTGCSRFGHGCVSGTVRGYGQRAEVRLPGGTWIGCALDCGAKLRDETIDFWETHRPGEGGPRLGWGLFQY